jgi:hypothetical protein
MFEMMCQNYIKNKTSQKCATAEQRLKTKVFPKVVKYL